MKTFNKKLLALLLVVASVFAFVGCGNGDKLTGNATVIVKTGNDLVYNVDLGEAGFSSNDTVLDLLTYVSQNNGLTFEATVSNNAQFGYSAYINEIGSLKPVENQYVAFFHNKESDKDVSAFGLPNVNYNETTLYYSGLGIGSVKLVDGIVVYFALAGF